MLAISVVFVIEAAAAEPQPPPAQIYVVDADTVMQGGKCYRLTGFDAPEIYRSKCPAEKQRALRAAVRLMALMAAGDARLVDTGKLGKWNVRLATLKIDGKDVAQIAIAEGWGRAYDGRTRRKSWCRKSVLQAK